MKYSIALLAIAGLAVVACKETGNKTEKALASVSPKAEAVSVERGAYLVNSIGCADCHSPKVMSDHGVAADPNRNMSGHPSDEALPPSFSEALQDVILFNMHGTAQKGPWGVSFAANITPDPTGIGNWSEEQFVRAIKKGKYKGFEESRTLLPLMPWEYYRNLTDDDVKSIFAYLKTIKPIENVVPAPVPPTGV